jgi:hypothetical protein
MRHLLAHLSMYRMHECYHVVMRKIKKTSRPGTKVHIDLGSTPARPTFFSRNFGRPYLENHMSVCLRVFTAVFVIESAT